MSETKGLKCSAIFLRHGHRRFYTCEQVKAANVDEIF